MNKNEVIMPSKEEVIKLLDIAKNGNTIPMQTIGDLLAIKWADRLFSEIECTPVCGVEGLVEFFNDYGIDDSCSIEDALKKITAK